MIDTKIVGKAWVGGDNISTYGIIAQRRWDLNSLDPVVLGKWALEDTDSDFTDKENALRDSEYTIVVAGENFGGGGKSMEHPIIALKGAGIKIVLADSFARFNFRNSVNNGLPVIICKGIKDKVKKGDELTVDLSEGYVINHRTNEKLRLVPLSGFVLEVMEVGGLINYTKLKLQNK